MQFRDKSGINLSNSPQISIKFPLNSKQYFSIYSLQVHSRSFVGTYFCVCVSFIGLDGVFVSRSRIEFSEPLINRFPSRQKSVRSRKCGDEAGLARGNSMITEICQWHFHRFFFYGVFRLEWRSLRLRSWPSLHGIHSTQIRITSRDL